MKNQFSYYCRRVYKFKASYLFITPFTILFLAFTVIPVVIAIFYSFTQFNVMQSPVFIGFENYRRLFFEDDIFIIAIKNTFVFAVIIGPVSYLLCLMIAWFVNELSAKSRAVMTLFFYTPALAGGASLSIWLLIFSSDQYGVINSLLLSLGLLTTPVPWLNDQRFIVGIIILITLWSSLGHGFLAFIAGLQNVDKTLYEAGAVDGIKNRYQELWFITLPAMKGQLMFGAILNITASFQIGDIVTQLCGFPSFNYTAHTVMNHLQDYGGIRYEMGYACAIATLLFLIMVSCNKFVQILLSKVGA